MSENLIQKIKIKDVEYDLGTTIDNVSGLQTALDNKQPKGTYATEEFVTNKIAEAELNDKEVDLSGYATKAELPTKVSDLTNDAGYLSSVPSEYVTETELAAKKYLTSYTETDPTVHAWAKAATKPSYTASEVGALPNTTKIPSTLSDLTADSTHRTVTDSEKSTWSAKAEISDIPTKVSELTNDKGYITSVPVVSVNNKTGAVMLSASDVGADASGTASSAVSVHNTNTSAHNDIRLLIDSLTTRLNTLADSDDTTLDQMSEVVAYIKSNKSLIDGITTSKINISDIVDNLTTNVSNKPLSAAQGVAIKGLIDAITVPTKISELTNDKGYLTSYTETDPTVPAWAKASSKPTYTKSEVGLGNVDNVKQYSINNPPPYPVTSVNGATGAVTVKAVPACSTSNNGQFLRVVNGVAAWSTVPNAEEATF